MSARWRQGQEFEIEYADGYHHVMRENRHELGMRGTGGVAQPRAAEAGQALGTPVREREQWRLTDQPSGEAQLPERRATKAALSADREWKSLMKRLPRTLAGILVRKEVSEFAP